MKRLYVLLLSLLLMAVFVACGSNDDMQAEETPTPTATPTPTPAPDPESEEPPVEPAATDEVALLEGANWSMEIAPGWVYMEGIAPPSLLSPGWNDSQLNVEVGSMMGESLENIADDVINMFAMMFVDFELVAVEFFLLNGNNVVMIAFEAPSAGVHTLYQFIIEHEGIAYIVTYIRADETDYFDDVRNMLDTFTILEMDALD